MLTDHLLVSGLKRGLAYLEILCSKMESIEDVNDDFPAPTPPIRRMLIRFTPQSSGGLYCKTFPISFSNSWTWQKLDICDIEPYTNAFQSIDIRGAREQMPCKDKS